MRRERWLLWAGLALLAAACGGQKNAVRPSEARDLEPDSPGYRVEDPPQARRRIELQDRLARASQRLVAGDMEAAEREARSVLRQDPGSADAHTVLAVVADRRGDAANAGEHYRKAAELAPERGPVLNNYGAWLCANGFPAESLVWFDRALADPRYASPASALANAGGCALKCGQYARAERDLRRALELDPVNPYALASMAENEYRKGRYFDARAFVERRLAAAPAGASVLQLAARIEQGLGDKAAAGRYEQRLRAEFPEAVIASSGENPRDPDGQSERVR